MKRLLLAFCSGALVFAACNSDKKVDAVKSDKDSTETSMTKTDETTQPSPPMDSATMMKNWQAFMTPGDMQAVLAKCNGTWATEVTTWESPDKPPMTSMGTTVNKMIMGGRYQETTNTGNVMGMPFEGKGITGYDNAKKVFVTTWIDNMGTGIMNMEGPWDEAAKTITLTGKATDAMTLTQVNYRQTFKIIDDNNQVMEMFAPGPDGKEQKMMQIKYTRKK